MPAAPTVCRWALKAPFSEQYARAREIGYALMADDLLEIADDGRNDKFSDDDGHVMVDHDVIARSRLRVDTRKWLLSKCLPKIYGDKLAHEHAGPNGAAIPLQFIELRAVRPRDTAD
jgi:hypothetical protein